MTTAVQEKLYTQEMMFDELIVTISEHKAMILDKKAPADLVKLYDIFRVGSRNQQGSFITNQIHIDFAGQIIPAFLRETSDFTYNKIAFDYSNNEILVWAELKDDDWESEKGFILAAAKVNANFNKFGYDITITFVEESDGLPVPNHYHEI
jgi:hypothetical protein